MLAWNAGASVRRFTRDRNPMHIRLEPQGKDVTFDGRARVADVLRRLGILAGTVMVIRGDDLLTDDDVVETDERIEIRAVISGGTP